MKKSYKDKRQKHIEPFIPYSQGCVFKIFRANNNFLDMVKEIGISRSTINSKINLLKLLSFKNWKFPRLKKLSLQLHIFKKYIKSIQETCKETYNEFK